jgi:hypothetical protein
MEFELLLGARPLEAVGRVVSAGADPQGGWRVDLELVAVAQVERDVLADFLQAVGAGSLRIRARRD